MCGIASRALCLRTRPLSQGAGRSNLELVRQVVDAFNRHDLDAMVAVAAQPSFTFAWGIDRGQAQAPSTHYNFTYGLLGLMLRAFPDLQWDVTNMVAAGDTVVVEGKMRGTFEGDMSSFFDASVGTIPATHQVETWSFLQFLRFDEDGKFVESRWYWDGFLETD
jgi:predicted ester cyclase